MPARFVFHRGWRKHSNMDGSIWPLSRYVRDSLMTMKDLTDRMESVREKVDNVQDKLDGKITRVSQDLDTKFVKISQDLASLQNNGTQAIGNVQTQLASLQATISNAKLIGVVAAVVISILGAAGVSQVWFSQKDMQEQRELFADLAKRAKSLTSDASKQRADFAKMMTTSLIEKIEIQLNSEGALDNLKDKHQVIEINKLATQLEAQNAFLPDEERSKYFLISKALDYYLDNKFDHALPILEGILGDDQDHFAYAYMRGACLVRVGRPNDAAEWFRRAKELTQGKQQQMTASAEAFARLEFWKLAKDSNPTAAAAALSEAVAQFVALNRNYPDFTHAYINLACAYSSQNNYTEVWNTFQHLEKILGVGAIAHELHEDMSRPSDRFFSNFIEHELNVNASLTSPQWERQVSEQLAARTKLDQ
jgi:tetratricopeptide (TPR) repeat protein